MFKSLLKSKIFVFLVVVCAIFAAISLATELQKKYQIEKEIRNLQDEISGIEAKNKEIAELINYYRTSEYRERQARSLLNLQKPGEIAVVLPAREETLEADIIQTEIDTRSNLEKWWSYYFGQNN